ncbi:MAG: hypothetical protein LUD71_03840 [Clostridiales bacterium]|nr:hypothetical protein [Clostridiales bacterium]
MAINSNSKLRDVIADERAVAIIDEYVPGFMDQTAAMGPCMGMKFSMLIKFPQAGIAPEDQKKLAEKLDALDA